MTKTELDLERKKLALSGCKRTDSYINATPEQKRRIKELSCIDMIDSILAYNCKGFKDAKKVIEYEKNSCYNYLADYINELGEERVTELVQDQINDIVDVEENVFTDNEGISYNSLIYCR